MNYYVLQIEKHLDGTKDSVGVYTYDNYDTVVANFHTRIGGSMKNANVAKALCLALDENGTVIRNEVWINPADPALAVEEE